MPVRLETKPEREKEIVLFGFYELDRLGFGSETTQGKPLVEIIRRKDPKADGELCFR